jgi:hypothetical protein
MDPVTLIVGALTAGALKGAGEAAGVAVKDAYQALKQRISARFAEGSSGETVLAELESDPHIRQEVLAKSIRESGAADDNDIILAAQRLMTLLDVAGSAGGKYVVDLRRAQGVQVGDHGYQSNIFNNRSTAD